MSCISGPDELSYHEDISQNYLTQLLGIISSNYRDKRLCSISFYPVPFSSSPLLLLSRVYSAVNSLHVTCLRPCILGKTQAKERLVSWRTGLEPEKERMDRAWCVLAVSFQHSFFQNSPTLRYFAHYTSS